MKWLWLFGVSHMVSDRQTGWGTTPSSDELTEKGDKIKSAMQEQYGEKKGESVFYASKNKGTITGVDSTTKISHTRSIPGLGSTTVTHSSDADGDKGGPLVTGPLPTPERHDDLLGEVSEPESTPRGPMTEAKAPERTKSAGDAKKKAGDQSSSFLPAQSGTPMNNIGAGVPAPTITARPNAGQSSSSTSGTSTGDSLRAMNSANRAFWSRRR
jgi:hypothetical protein